MSEHLVKAGGSAGERPIDEGVRLPHLRAWFRTRSAIVLHLSNGILQVCLCLQFHMLRAVLWLNVSKSFSF